MDIQLDKKIITEGQLFDLVEARINAKTQTFETMQAEIRNDVKTLLVGNGAINEHLKTLNGKTYKTAERVTKLEEEKANTDNILKEISTIKSDMIELKKASEPFVSASKLFGRFEKIFWASATMISIKVVSVVFNIPIDTMIDLVKDLL